MASRGNKVAKAVPFSPADLASIKDNPYIQRVIEDGTLRDNVTNVIESSKGAYEQLVSNGAPAKGKPGKKAAHLQTVLRWSPPWVTPITSAQLRIRTAWPRYEGSWFGIMNPLVWTFTPA